MTNIYSRNQIAKHYREFVGVSSEERIAMLAAIYHLPEQEVVEIVNAKAVCEYLQEIGTSHDPVLEVLITTAKKYHLTTEALLCAVDEHLLSMEAL